MEFVLGGVAGVCAGVFTNPFDVIKSRQQVQGELHAAAGRQRRTLPYRSMWKSVRSIVAAEGVRGLQKGLVPALEFQFVMNGTRMGMFQMLDNGRLTRDPATGELSPLRCMLWSGAAGLVSAAVACPLNMVKTQMQIQTGGGATASAVGYQHRHRGTWSALAAAYRAGGVRGLWRGFTGVLPRTCVASTLQLTTFKKCKDVFGGWEVSVDRLIGSGVIILIRNRNPQIFQGHGQLPVVVAASVVSGGILVCGLTPFDVVSTRLFNQASDPVTGRGLLYRNVFDCFAKTVRNEGWRGLYKGFVANYWRLVPHTILHLTFWEQFKVWNDVYVASG